MNLTWLGGVFLLRCREGAESPSRDLRGLTSGVLLVLLLEEPEMEAWTGAADFACSGGTCLRKGGRDTLKMCPVTITSYLLKTCNQSSEYQHIK